MKWTFRPIDWQRPVFVLATWVVRLRFLTFGSIALLPVLLLAAWLDPERPVRAQQQVAQIREARARDEARLVAQAKAVPATGVVMLDFRKLDFRLPPEAQDPAARDLGYNQWLPAGIKAYDGREIMIEGYMIPTRTEKGLVRECVVVPDRMSCCYGQVPRFCGFILARAAGKPLPIQMDQPLLFEGTLHVGDVFENGYWMTVYTLDCTAVDRSILSSRSRFR